MSVAVRFSLIEWGESLGESGKKAKLRREEEGGCAGILKTATI